MTSTRVDAWRAPTPGSEPPTDADTVETVSGEQASHETPLAPLRRATQVPPGPKLPVAAQSVLVSWYRHWWMPALRRRYGEMFTVRMAPFNREIVHLTSPDTIKTVYTGDRDVFHNGEGNEVLGVAMGDHSVLLQDGAEHMRIRQALMAGFNGAALRSYKEMITEITRQEVEKIPAGKPIKAHEHMNTIALEIILQVIFGVTDEKRLAVMRPAVEAMASIKTALLLAWYYEPLRPYWPFNSFGKIRDRLDALIYEEIADRRQTSNLAERDDVLSKLLSLPEEKQLTDAELRDNLVSLLLAGHDTTATALAWTLHDLARNPETQRKAHADVDSGDGTYVEAVFKESMRLHPVIDGVAYVLKQDVTIGDYHLPAGITVMVDIGVMHQLPEFFPNPTKHDPERYLGTQPAPNTWMPFGGGARRCIGGMFAMMESAEILQQILKRYSVHVDPHVAPEKPVSRNITLAPDRGARITLIPR